MQSTGLRNTPPSRNGHRALRHGGCALVSARRSSLGAQPAQHAPGSRAPPEARPTLFGMATTEYEAVPRFTADGPAARLGTVVMKFGGTSVGDAAKLKAVAARLVAARAGGHSVVGVLSAMGHTTDELLDLATRGLRAPQAARARHARLRRRADHLRARRDGDRGPRPPGDLADGLAGRDRHRHGAREGEDRRDPRPQDPRGARGRADRARRRLPGRLDRVRGDDARPRRLRHDRGRARGRARRRPLRDLHRRARRLHGRPAARARARASSTPSASTRCSRWRRPARA